MTDTHERRTRRLVIKLMLVTLGMFGFGFALVPAYRVICNITGQGIWAATPTAQAKTVTVDPNRWVTVELVGSVSGAWEFRPTVNKIKVRPGELAKVAYKTANLAAKPAVAQAVYGVAPIEAKRFLVKPDCFCFTRQPFGASEARDLTVTFYLDPALPPEIETVTLAYTLYDVTDQQPN